MSYSFRNKNAEKPADTPEQLTPRKKKEAYLQNVLNIYGSKNDIITYEADRNKSTSRNKPEYNNTQVSEPYPYKNKTQIFKPALG